MKVVADMYSTLPCTTPNIALSNVRSRISASASVWMCPEILGIDSHLGQQFARRTIRPRSPALNHFPDRFRDEVPERFRRRRPNQKSIGAVRKFDQLLFRFGKSEAALLAPHSAFAGLGISFRHAASASDDSFSRRSELALMFGISPSARCNTYFASSQLLRAPRPAL